MDTNRNGVLEPGEVPQERRRMFTFLAGRAGLDPNKPIPISTIREKMTGGGSSSASSNQDSQSDKDKKEKEEEGEPLVPGFGVPQEVIPVPGFGKRVELTSAMPMGRPRGGSSNSRSRSDRDDRDSDERYRRFAQYMLRRYDRNENGKLDKDEWGPLKERGRDPASYDRNRDGAITVEEMAAQMAASRRGDSHAGSNGSDRSNGTVASRWEGRKSYRFLSPRERLPDGLPDWFLERDADEDGQVAMAEYTTFWSDSKVREFLRYDLNRDGIITPQECLSGGIELAEEGATSGKVGGDGPSGGEEKSPAPSGASGGEKPWWM